MENFEGWDPHSTRPNIDIDQGTDLLYRRTPGGSFRRIQQKMTECQQLEIFRRASGFIEMTVRSRGRTNPPAEPAPDASHR
jgi:hypothetical protein